MTTTELIELIQRVEFGASNRPREIHWSVYDVNGNIKDIAYNVDIKVIGSGDGVAGADLELLIECEVDDYSQELLEATKALTSRIKELESELTRYKGMK